MGFNIFMTREQVIEKYWIPPELEAEVFAVLKPVMGSGANAQYLESRVNQQLETHFANKERLRCWGPESYRKEEANMAKGWADTVADEDTEEETSVPALEPLLVDEKQAARMLGVSKRKIFDLNKQGILPSRMVGSRKLYSVKRLREFADGEAA